MILLSNDDGVRADGIKVLARALHEAQYDITVVAPAEEQSGASHSMTFFKQHIIAPFEGDYPPGVPVYSCTGTPSDCVLLGTETYARGAECVITGINRGANLGGDVTYSGTVGAAMEAVITGRRAIAVSLAFMKKEEQRPDFRDNVPANYATAAHVAVRVVKWLERTALPDGVLLNVNVPDVPLPELKGIKITRQGIKKYADRVVRIPHGEDFTYSITGTVVEVLEEGTDVWAVAGGYASVTPIHLDLTCYPAIEVLKPLELDN